MTNDEMATAGRRAPSSLREAQKSRPVAGPMPLKPTR
jgi:hypothetical protein